LRLNSAKKILVIRLSSLGDIILSTPLIRTIKKRYPHIKVDYLLREEYQDSLLLNPYIDNLLTFTNKKSDDIKKRISKEKYDVVLDLQNNLRSAGLTEYSAAKKIVYKKRNFSKFLLVNFKINLLKNAASVPERYAAEIDDFELDGEGLELFTNRTPSVAFDPGKQYIGLAPGSRHFTKKWLPEYYIELGRLLSKDDYGVLLFGGKDDKEICRIISEEIPGSINLSNNNDLLQTSADMKNCLAVICNDSGLLHTAAASGIPVVGIFGSTVKEFGFFPYGVEYRLMEHLSLPCRPCTHIGRSSCPKKHFKCMKEITPVSVFENLIALIAPK